MAEEASKEEQAESTPPKKSAKKKTPAKKAKKAKKPPTSPKTADKVTEGKLYITKDPRVYAETIPRLIRPHKRMVGLDLANSTGVTFCDIIPGHPVKGAHLVMGQWDLSLGDYDSGPLRHIRLKTFLAHLQPDVLLFEEVKYVGQNTPPGMNKMNLTALVARAVTGAQMVASLATTLTTWCEEQGIPAEGIPIGVLKKYATGQGAANKEDMIKACNEKFGSDFDPETYKSTGVDNIADSAFLCALAVQNYMEAQ